MANKTKEHRPLTLGLVRALAKKSSPIYIEYTTVQPATFEIPNLVSAGEDVMVIRSADFMGVVPKSELSFQKSKPDNRLIGQSRGAYLLDEYELENADGSTTNLVILSVKAFEKERKADVLEDLQSSEFVTAQVSGFSEYGAILRYKGLILELNNGSFSGKTVPASTVLSVGDEVDVVFRKFRHGGRTIIVDPLYPFPHPEYMNPVDRSALEVGQVFNAEIRNITPTLISVSIGRDTEGGRNFPMLATCRHPHPAVAQYLSADIPVRVKLTKVGRHLRASIVDINRDYVDDAIFEYRQMVSDKMAEREVQV